jgi:hypothetical protein
MRSTASSRESPRPRTSTSHVLTSRLRESAAGFDRHAAHASESGDWDLYELEASHLPYVTAHAETTAMLLELAA